MGKGTPPHPNCESKPSIEVAADKGTVLRSSSASHVHSNLSLGMLSQT